MSVLPYCSVVMFRHLGGENMLCGEYGFAVQELRVTAVTRIEKLVSCVMGISKR